jgi:hypothetical protein
MSNIKFNREEQILKLGFNYAFEKPTKYFIQDLVIDTENAIRQLHESEQNIYRFLACNKIKQIQNTISTNILHKRQNYVTKQIHKKLEQNNLIVTKATKADKGNTIVIIKKSTLTQKNRRLSKRQPFHTTTKRPYRQVPKTTVTNHIKMQ